MKGLWGKMKKREWPFFSYLFHCYPASCGSSRRLPIIVGAIWFTQFHLKNHHTISSWVAQPLQKRKFLAAMQDRNLVYCVDPENQEIRHLLIPNYVRGERTWHQNLCLNPRSSVFREKKTQLQCKQTEKAFKLLIAGAIPCTLVGSQCPLHSHTELMPNKYLLN